MKMKLVGAPAYSQQRAIASEDYVYFSHKIWANNNWILTAIVVRLHFASAPWRFQLRTHARKISERAAPALNEFIKTKRFGDDGDDVPS